MRMKPLHYDSDYDDDDENRIRIGPPPGEMYTVLRAAGYQNYEVGPGIELGRLPVARPSWDEWFMEMADVVAKRSTCNRLHVGCVIARDHRILTTGYNGSPAGFPHCDDVGHLMVDGHCRRTLHGEHNAIIQAALHGVSISGATVYLTHQPCLTCALMLIQAGIARLVYRGEYNDALAWEMLRQSGIVLDRYGG